MILICFCLLTGNKIAFAQGEYNNWLFGDKSGITFNSGVPVNLSNPINLSAIPASISDCAGNLLFYTDGKFIYDKNHIAMAGAFLLGGDYQNGGYSNYQIALIAPWPGNQNKYFVLTTSTIYGFRYSVVDMALNNGLGGVTALNILIESDIESIITGTRAVDGGYWIVIRKRYKEIFHSYKIDINGFNQIPIVTIFSNNYINSTSGTMKFSADGNLIGLANYNRINIYSFNNLTGTLNSLFDSPILGNSIFGCEFSPDSKKLYFNKRNFTNDYLYQVDVSDTNYAVINQSITIISNNNSPSSSKDLLLAPDGKIYNCKINDSIVGVINLPNSSGSSCNYNPLGFTTTNLNGHGFNNIISSTFNQKLTINNFCQSDTTTFSYTGSSCIDSVLWKFNDPGALDDTASGWMAKHKYSAPGTYPVVLTRYFSYKTDSIIDTVTILPYPLVNLGSDTTICSTASITLNAGNPGKKYLWKTGDTTQTITADTAGTYWVRVSNSGCITFDTIVVSKFPPVTFAVSKDTIICSNGAAALSASGAVSYSWSPATGLSCTNCAAPVANPAFTTTYTVTATDLNGCSAAKTVTVTVRPAPNAAASGSNACAGVPAQLSASGGAQYSWQPAAFVNFPNLPNPKATVSATTVFTVTVTGNNGCASTVTATVNILLPPALSVPADLQICKGNSTTLSAVGSGTFSWSPATGLSCTNCPDPVASPAFTTVYTVTLTGVNGCTAKDSVKVEVVQNIAVTATGATACAGTGTQIIASGGTSYSWSPAAGLSDPNIADPVATVSATTIYTVTVTDAAGCTGSATAVVNILPAPALSVAGDATICAGASASIATTGNGTVSWSPAAGLSDPNIKNPVATPAVTTVYTATLTDANGCTASDSVTIIVDPAPALAVQDVTTCSGVPIQFNVNSNANSYSWSPAARLSDPNIKNPVATVQNTTTYTVTATGANGCSSIDSVTVNALQLPALAVGADKTICEGDTIEISASGNGTFSWSPAALLSEPDIENPLAFPAATTVFTVTLSDANGCEAKDSVKVTVLPAPILIVSNDTTVCKNATVQLIADGATAYSWSPAAPLSDPNIKNPIATVENTTTFTLTGTTGSCAATATVTFTTHPDDLIDAGADLEVCEGEAITLAATGGTDYNWQPEQFLENASKETPVATLTATTTFTVSATDINNCISKDTITVNVLPKPQVNAGADITLPAGQSIQLNATGAAAYLWQPDQGLNDYAVPDPIASPSFTLTYTVYGTGTNGCIATDELTITIKEEEFVYLPTAFSPNGDGTNDLYIIQYNPNFTFHQLTIFNRWGEIVFETTNQNHHWNGHIKNGPAPLGTYAVMVKGDVKGKVVIAKRNVTVLR